MFWVFEKGIFQFFANFLVTKLKSFSGKASQSFQDQLNWKLVIGRFLGNIFEVTLRSKTIVLTIWKEEFSVFLQFMNDKGETNFWESKAKHQKLFKLQFGHRNLLRKWFWSFLELKNQICGRLKIAFFSFFASFWLTKLKPFSGKLRQNVQNYLNQNLVIGDFPENVIEATLSSKMNVLIVSKKNF